MTAYIDGKSIAVTRRDINEYSINRSQRGTSKYVQSALRAFHASSTVKLLMGQELIPKGRSEKGIFRDFLDKLVLHYGRTKLLEVFSLDAGFTSIANAQAIINHGYHYIFAVKDPRVHRITRTAHELLAEITIDAADTVEKEYSGGKHITRSLYRSGSSALPLQVKGWEHVQEVWRICKETLHADGKVTTENRYFATSIACTTLTGSQVLKAIRLHWSIENNANWVLDVAWKEDRKPWCHHAVELISLMRMIAYNTVARFKLRCLAKTRGANKNTWTWEDVLYLIKISLFPLRCDTLANC